MKYLPTLNLQKFIDEITMQEDSDAIIEILSKYGLCIKNGEAVYYDENNMLCSTGKQYVDIIGRFGTTFIGVDTK